MYFPSVPGIMKGFLLVYPYAIIFSRKVNNERSEGRCYLMQPLFFTFFLLALPAASGTIITTLVGLFVAPAAPNSALDVTKT